MNFSLCTAAAINLRTMLTPFGARTILCRNSPGILNICQRHINDEEFANNMRSKEKPVNPHRPVPGSETPEVLDPLEFRDIGEFKRGPLGERNVPKAVYHFLKKNSIFRGVKNQTFMGTMRNMVAKGKALDQNYNPERVRALGPDLAVAHFIVCRGGGIRFVGDDKFIRGKVNRSYEVLPNEKDPNYKVDGIDFSGGDFVYEGISNLVDLKYLSWISFRNCTHVDNWFLDHLSCVAPTVEYIDLTGCHKINQLGLSCLYRFKKLKCVNVEDVSDSIEFNLACLTMEAEIPDFIFIGLKLKPTPKSVFNE